MKHQTIILILGILQTAVLSGAVLWWVSQADSDDGKAVPPMALPDAEIRLSDAQMAVLRADLIDDVRNVVRQELQAVLGREDYLPASSDAGRDGAQLADSAIQTTEQRLKRENAVIESDTIVTQAITEGVLTREDALRLDDYLPDLPATERIKLIDRIFQAANRQELEIDQMPHF